MALGDEVFLELGLHELQLLASGHVDEGVDEEVVYDSCQQIVTKIKDFLQRDGTTKACLLKASLAPDPALTEMVVWAMEEFMSVAVDTQTDMMFLLEHFCGHGYQRDDPNGRCYRGPDAELWFDLTCIHPNATGHTAMAEMFTDIIVE